MPVPREDGDNEGILPATRTNRYFNILTTILLIQTSQRTTRKVSYSIFCNFKPITDQDKAVYLLFWLFLPVFS